jgi:hypothetical protein
MDGVANTTGHKPAHPAGRLQADSERCCPYCGSPTTKAMLARIAEAERERMVSLEASLKAKFAEHQRQAAMKSAAEIAQAKAEVGVQIEKARKEAAAKATAALAPKLAKAVAEAVNVERTKAYSEKLTLEQQLEEVKRRLQRRSAHDIGEPAEIDLYAAIAAAFPEDRVSRVSKGTRGPDVIVEVVSEGTIAGKIVLDSKDHLRWSNRFTSKLRADQIAEAADFAVLSTNTFPAGARELYIQDNVIVARPARVPVLLQLLRRQIIESFRLKLSTVTRNEKGAKLLTFIASTNCTDLFERAAKATADLLNIEESDAAWQAKTRTKRTVLIHGVQGAHGEFVGAINRILTESECPQ